MSNRRTPQPLSLGRCSAVLVLLALGLGTSHGRAADSLTVGTPGRRPMAELLAEADSAVRARGGARADDAQLLLSWNAPWGAPRARDVRMPACEDSLQADTLYLSVRTGRAAERFTGFTARLLVHATGTDTLGPWWSMKSRGGSNPGALRVEWVALQDWPGAQSPFHAQGQGLVQLENDRGVARLDMVYAVPMEAAVPISPDVVYTLGRVVLLHHPQRRLTGCDRPVVIEWAKGTLAFGLKDEPSVSRGARFVSYGGPSSLADDFRGPRVPVWRPPGSGH